MANSKTKPAAETAAPPASGNRWDAFFHTTLGWWTLCALLAALVIWTFWPSVNCQFLFFDDYGYLIFNRHVNQGFTWDGFCNAFVDLGYSNWVPLVWLTHMLDFQFYGNNPWGHHLTNILFHTASTLILFWLLKRLTGSLWTSLVAVLIFALHPLRVQSVTWVCERKDILSMFFGLLTLCAYVRYAEEARKPAGWKWRFYGLTLLAFILCMLSKSMLVTLPCVMMLLDFWPLERWKQAPIWRLALEKGPFFLIVIPVAIVAGMAERQGGDFILTDLPLSLRIQTALMSYIRLLGRLFWPQKLAVFYPYPHAWPLGGLVLAVAVVGGVSFLGLLLWKRWPCLLVGWFWYLGTMFPVLGLIVQVNAQSTANHYTYFPMIGLAMVLGLALQDLSKHWPNRAVLVSVLVALGAVACIIRTRAEIVYFNDDITLYERSIQATSEYDDCNFMAHNDLGMLIAEKDPARAVKELERALQINPHYAETERTLASMYMQANRLDEAAALCRSALKDNPRDSRIPFYWAIIAYRQGKPDEAIEHFKTALEEEPNNMDFVNDLAPLLMERNRYAEGVPYLQRICTNAPADPQKFNLLGVADLRLGRFDDGIAAFQSALALAPDNESFKGNLAAAIQAKQQAVTNAPPAAHQ
jgi:protein O-mannosyl-transferase